MRRRRTMAHIIREVVPGIIASIVIAAALILMISHDGMDTGPDAWNRQRIMTTTHYEEVQR